MCRAGAQQSCHVPVMLCMLTWHTLQAVQHNNLPKSMPAAGYSTTYITSQSAVYSTTDNAYSSLQKREQARLTMATLLGLVAWPSTSS